jgi:serine/threonine-protein kinase ATR
MKDTYPEREVSAATTIFTEVTQNPNFLESKKPRIAAMIALRRIAAHSRDSGFVDLETSTAGQWCLQSLNSSLRELRIAAGRTLTIFLARRVDRELDDLLARNRKNAIAILKSMSEKNRPHLVETCIMAWGQLGRVVDEDELNLVLLQLCDYLGSSNHLISAFAFNEILKLAESRNTTPRLLFEPYWRSLAYLATKDMLQRPQRSRAIAELLQVSVNELLLLIQTHALPWLVLDRRKEIIQRIAEARGETDIWRPLMDGSNLAAVLALLLAQEQPNDTVEFAKSRLEEISPHFQSEDMLNLLQSEPVLIAMELLKAAGDADASRKALVSSHDQSSVMGN